MRLAAIGLDAMEWELVERLMREGALPNLAALADTSAHCRLRNVREYRSELPWTQFITGRDASEMGYWSTVEFNPETYDVWARGAHHGEPFWNALRGSPSILFDVPHTTLDHAVDGVQVTAWGAHSPQYPRVSQPRGLLTEIDRRFGPHPTFERDYEECWFDPEYLQEMTDALVSGARLRLDVVRWLMARHPDWNLLLTVMSEAHSVGHHAWHGVDDDHPLAAHPTATAAYAHAVRVYQALDEAVGRFVASVPGDVPVLVFSLHGMQANTNDLAAQTLVPELLYRLETGRTYLRGLQPAGAWRDGGHPVLEPRPDRTWDATLRELRDDAVGPRRLGRRGQPRGGRPRFGHRAIPTETHQSLAEVGLRRGHLRWQPATWYERHWPNMRAFAIPTFSDAHIRINLQGRERNGIVPLDDYHLVCKQLAEELRACIDVRTGRPAVDDVAMVRDSDPLAPDGPTADLVVLFDRPVDAIEHPDAGVVGPFPFMRSGEHSSNGFAFLKVPGGQPVDLGERSALDVTPTILHFLGVTPHAGIVGSPLVERAPARA